jgi:hypothetical protein
VGGDDLYSFYICFDGTGSVGGNAGNATKCHVDGRCCHNPISLPLTHINYPKVLSLICH